MKARTYSEGVSQMKWLQSLPVNDPNRAKLKDQVPRYRDDAKAIAKIGSRSSPEFRGSGGVANLFNFGPLVFRLGVSKNHPGGTIRVGGDKPPQWTPAMRPCLSFESGGNTLPGMEKWKDKCGHCHLTKHRS